MYTEKRISAAEAALEAHGEAKDPGAGERNLADLLTDLMHLALYQGLEFDTQLTVARVNYDSET